MSAPWQPYREPVRNTAMRTVGIALVVGGVVSLASRGRIAWPMAALLVLWISLGGHFVELFFLNWLRRRLPVARGVQIAARLATWFVGGVVLVLGMNLTARLLIEVGLRMQPAWWLGGLVFIGVELVAHLVLQLRGRPSFYNGRG